MKVSVIIAAAGSGKRFGGDTPKQYLKIDGVTVLEKALDAFCSFYGDDNPHCNCLAKDCELIIVSDDPDECRTRISCEASGNGGLFYRGLSLRIIKGGTERQDSINNALNEARGEYVLIHDAARPFVSRNVIRNVTDALCSGKPAVIPCVKPKNTIRTQNQTLDRSKLYEVQTPQGFETEFLRRAFANAYENGFYGTDDASIVEYYCGNYSGANEFPQSGILNDAADDSAASVITIVDGDYRNIKITTPEDMPGQVRFGNGYDVHRLVEGRPLMLGCTHIPYEKGLLGHSDADVLAHAMADAILGAASLGDIGHIFPDNAKETEGMAGEEILKKTTEMVVKIGYTIMMVDGTVIAEKPKLAPHIMTMRINTAKAIGIDVDRVSIKATTEENMSDVSRNGMAAIATCVLVKQ